jgi:hypothetical protein
MTDGACNSAASPIVFFRNSDRQISVRSRLNSPVRLGIMPWKYPPGSRPKKRHHGQGDRCLLASHPMVRQVLLHSGLDTSGSCRSQSPHPPAQARSGSAGADRALAVVPDSPARPDAVSAPCPYPLVPAAGCRTLRIIPQRSGSGRIRSRSWRRSGSNVARSSAGGRSRTTSASNRPASGGSVQRLGGSRGHAPWRASICPGISAQKRLPEEPNNVSTPNLWTLPSARAR